MSPPWTAIDAHAEVGGMRVPFRLDVRSSSDSVHELLAQPGRHAVVFLNAEERQSGLAHQVARSRGGDIVLAAHPGVQGLLSPVSSGSPYLFGATYTRRHPGCARQSPIVDSMTRLAELQHSASQGRWLGGAGDPWDAKPDRKVPGGCSWSRLPEFYREDNVRQVWHLLQWFTLNGWEWRELDEGRPPSAEDIAQALPHLVSSEYERWREFRVRSGWRAPLDDERRHDARRLHPEVRAMGSVDYNTALAERLILRLWSIGLAPQPLTPLRRIGAAWGRELSEPKAWVAESGLRFQAAPGDWCIFSSDEQDGHFVEAEVARQLYVEVASDDGDADRGAGASPKLRLSRDPSLLDARWQDPRHLMGRRATRREVVESPEGPVIAEPGDWIVAQRIWRRGRQRYDRWPVPQARFDERYEVRD